MTMTMKRTNFFTRGATTSLFLWAAFSGSTTTTTTCLATTLVTSLTDATFEHQTQASTGSTTGSWLVLFYSTIDEQCHDCPAIQTHFEQLLRPNSDTGSDGDSSSTSLYDKGIVLGTVNVATSPHTASRFEIESTPTVLYIHRGKYYTVPQSALTTQLQKMDDTSSSSSTSSLTDRLHHFVMDGGYSKVDGRPIPAPPSLLMQVKDTVKELFDQYYPDMIVICMALMFGAALFGVFNLALNDIEGEREREIKESMKNKAKVE